VGCVFKAQTLVGFVTPCVFFAKTKVGEMIGRLCCKMLKNVTVGNINVTFSLHFPFKEYDPYWESNRRPYGPRPNDRPTGVSDENDCTLFLYIT
jgi:hypothetical protein